MDMTKIHVLGMFLGVVLATGSANAGDIHADELPAYFGVFFPAGTQSRKLPDIQGVFDQNKEQFARVFKEAHKVRPALKGRVDMAIVLRPTGRVETVSVIESALDDPRLEDAIVKIVSRLDFGQVEGDGYFAFRYPLYFFETNR